MVIHSHKDLTVWKRSMELVLAVYTLTENFPKTEIYGLTSQMRRCAVSIPSNIAEGRSRGTRKDYLNFLRVSLGSVAELETQIEISKMLPFGEKLYYNDVEQLLLEVVKMLKVMIKNLNPKLKAPEASEAFEARSY